MCLKILQPTHSPQNMTVQMKQYWQTVENCQFIVVTYCSKLSQIQQPKTTDLLPQFPWLRCPGTGVLCSGSLTWQHGVGLGASSSGAHLETISFHTQVTGSIHLLAPVGPRTWPVAVCQPALEPILTGGFPSMATWFQRANRESPQSESASKMQSYITGLITQRRHQMCHILWVRKPITGFHTLQGGDCVHKGMDMRMGGHSRVCPPQRTSKSHRLCYTTSTYVCLEFSLIKRIILFNYICICHCKEVSR